MIKTAAVIVSYNPDLKILNKALDIISKMCQAVIIVDNSDKEILSAEQVANAILIPSKGNLGIASALNLGFKKAAEMGAKWVLSFDQDSMPQEDMLERYLEFILEHPKAGQLGPSYFWSDKATGSAHQKESQKRDKASAHRVEHLISSGAMTSMEAYSKVGGFRDELFIDLVDVDFSLRLADEGYELWQLDDVRMDHKLGDERKGLMLNGKLRFVYVEHAPVRWYYMVRNALYVNEWHHKKHRQFCRQYLRKRIWKNVFKMLLFGEHKCLKFEMVCCGISDWKHKVSGKYQTKPTTSRTREIL